MPPLPPWTLTELCKLLLSLVSLLLPSNYPWQKEIGTMWQPERKQYSKMFFSYYFPPLKWQNSLELFLRSNRRCWWELDFYSLLSLPCQEKVVLEGNTAQRKGESVTGRGNEPNRNWTGSPWTRELSLCLFSTIHWFPLEDRWV